MKILVAACGFAWSDVGGAQRIAAEFSNTMVQRGHNVMVMFENKRQKPCFYKLDSKLRLCDIYQNYGILLTSCYASWQKIIREIIHGIDGKRVINWNLYCGCLGAKSKELNRDIQSFHPDIIVSFDPAATAALMYLSIHTPIISMLHCDPEVLRSSPAQVRKALVCVQNQVLLPYMKENFLRIIPNSRVEVIPNAVTQYRVTANLAKKKQIYRLICVARLHTDKRPDILIESFAKIANVFPNWILELWGEDVSLGEKLRKQIQTQHLEDRIFLKGTTTDIGTIYINADLFALASPKEGFGLGMAEAMSAGLPVVAFKNCQAASTLIQDDDNGLLAEDTVSDFSMKLGILMKDQERRVEMGLAAHRSMKRFTPEIVYDKWEILMKNVVASSKL